MYIMGLPNAILKALGFEFDEPTADEDESEAEPGEERVAGDNSVTPEILALWDKVKGRLQEQMPRASYETWVQSTTPVKNNGALWIGAREPYACKWLESKLSDQVNEILSECGHGAPVKFVVLESEEE